MKKTTYHLSLAAALMAANPAFGLTAAPPSTGPADKAASDVIAYQITAELTAEVGHRQAGTQAEQRGRDWALKKLAKLGFANVREEKFMMPTWVRGAETAVITAPQKMELSIAALGNSGSTGAAALTGEIVYFQTFDDLVAAKDDQVKGKIIFIDHNMTATQDGSSYSYFGRARFQGPNVAAKKGALAILVRSAGTADHDHPHTGNTNFEAGVTPIPAAAVSNLDADKFVALYVKIRRPIAASLTLTPKNLGQQPSGNVIAQVTGSNSALPPVVIACHLDSWDLATGAFDDAAGCGIITAAASYIKNHGTPLRTIRILWAGAEEVGVWGGKDYAVQHAATPHALAMESDFGADRVWRVDFTLPEGAKPLQDRITRRLALLGIAPGRDKATGGADVGPIIAAQGLGVIDLQQDGSRYFEIHHNARDTIALIDKKQLQQNVVAWTIVLEELSNYAGELRPDIKP